MKIKLERLLSVNLSKEIAMVSFNLARQFKEMSQMVVMSIILWLHGIDRKISRLSLLVKER